ncbi:hypothetical protein SmJEL517_g04581 [Synchytrium microbalum]|uniref:Kinetochore protein Spc24 n=1 Tax=Synchytrium microbalum TaxID=1806994 RepID=A0A507C2I7_9FUNG|nr:uncharacterized protein SmJEL517_g04581 [Synchytrium microbalum]TPX32294.1 hypothetical protein SmJEL517_g04581 [Synchytrium microbalum]
MSAAASNINNSSNNSASSMDELPVLVPELLQHLSPREDTSIISDILDNERKTSELRARQHEHTRIVLATLAQRLQDAQTRQLNASTEASSLKYSVESSKLESQQTNVKHELNSIHQSIGDLEERYQAYLQEMQALEEEERVEAGVPPDPSLLKLHILKSLGVEMMTDDKGVYTHAHTRSVGHNDIVVTPFEAKYSDKYYADLLWEACS